MKFVSLPKKQFSLVTQSCPTLCDPMDCNMPGLPVHQQLLEFTQTHVHWVGDAIILPHALSFPSLTFNLSQHQGFSNKSAYLHQVAKVLEFQTCALPICTPGLPVRHQLLEFTQTHVHWVNDAIQPSHPLLSLSPPSFNLSQHQSLQMSQFFASGGQSIGVSASASVLPMNIQDWFSLEWTGLISL